MELGWEVPDMGSAMPQQDPEPNLSQSEIDVEEAAFESKLRDFLKPWPVCASRKQVVSVLLSLRDVASVSTLEQLVRLLLGAPEPPALLRVLLPTEMAAHELAARFRGELRPAGLRHRVRDRCLLIASEVDTMDGSHQLLDIAPPLVQKLVNSMVMIMLPNCFGVWDTFVRVGLPAGVKECAADKIIEDIGAQIGAVLDPAIQGHGAVTRQLVLTSEPGGKNARLYHATNLSAPGRYLGSWLEVCRALGLSDEAESFDDPKLIVAGWLDTVVAA